MPTPLLVSMWDYPFLRAKPWRTLEYELLRQSTCSHFNNLMRVIPELIQHILNTPICKLQSKKEKDFQKLVWVRGLISGPFGKYTWWSHSSQITWPKYKGSDYSLEIGSLSKDNVYTSEYAFYINIRYFLIPFFRNDITSLTWYLIWSSNSFPPYVFRDCL